MASDIFLFVHNLIVTGDALRPDTSLHGGEPGHIKI